MAANEMAGDNGAVRGGLWLPLITPLRDGRPDIPALQSLVQDYGQAGITGFVLFGSTGEGNLLAMEEKLSVLNAVRGVAPRTPIVLGAGGVDTRGICLAIRKLDKLNPDGWLVPPPYYLCAPPDGVLWHYQEVSWATRRPVIIYDVPKRTGTALTVELMEHLCQYTGCVAVKECDPAVLSAMNARKRLTAFCGEDLAFLTHFLQGGFGAISASAHIRPDVFMAVMELAQADRQAEAEALFLRLKPLIKLLFQEPNPGPIKLALACAGRIANELRLPMTPASAVLGRRLEHALSRLPSEGEVADLRRDGQTCRNKGLRSV